MQKTKDKIYCAKHSLEYTPENVKKAYEKELGFGCFVKIKTDDSDFHYKCKPEWGKYKVLSVSPKGVVITVLWHYPNSEIDCRERIESKELKILGTPITLEDVLRASRECEFCKKYNAVLKITNSGKFEIEIISTNSIDGNVRYKTKWQLGKTFDWHIKERPETTNFIKELLS